MFFFKLDQFLAVEKKMCLVGRADLIGWYRSLNINPVSYSQRGSKGRLFWTILNHWLLANSIFEGAQ